MVDQTAPSDEEHTLPLTGKSGVQRDGTLFEGSYYTDAHWCRFQRTRPRKIGGYRSILAGFSGISRGMYLDAKNNQNYIYSGSANVLEMTITDNTGAGSVVNDRTPTSFPVSPNNVWSFDCLFDAGGSSKRIIAHAGQNLAAINSAVQSPIYFGDADNTPALTTIGTSVSGGIFCLAPYLFALDNDGTVLWTPPNTMSFSGAGSGSARIAPNKLIKGVKTRGGSGFAPSGLIWSLDELYRVFFVGGAPVFEFDYIADTALMSTSAVVEYNGNYYWPDLNKFVMFNGATNDMVNDLNLNYFYDNYNKMQRQKIWGVKAPRFNEIWWFWPKGNATECTDVLIYNVKEDTWYDTAWATDQLARSAGIYSKSFPYPVMMGMDINSLGKYTLWQHEFGVDRFENGTSYAILSNFTTQNLSYCATLGSNNWIGIDRWIELMRVEPDFVQSGNMTLTVIGQPYAASSDQSLASVPYTFSPTTGKIDMKEQRRQMQLKFESNVVGGDYQLGLTLMNMMIGDGRQ